MGGQLAEVVCQNVGGKEMGGGSAELPLELGEGVVRVSGCLPPAVCPKSILVTGGGGGGLLFHSRHPD